MFAALVVKISTKEITSIIGQNSIDSNSERFSPLIHTTQVLFNLDVTQRNKLAVQTVGAFVFFPILKSANIFSSV